jgi:DNA-binding MarR family transcriptional regulator
MLALVRSGNGIGRADDASVVMTCEEDNAREDSNVWVRCLSRPRTRREESTVRTVDGIEISLPWRGAARAMHRPARGADLGLLPAEQLNGAALVAWRAYIQSHAAILRELDAELTAAHSLTTRDYEVLLYLAQSPDGQLAMSAIAQRTMLTRSGITRLVDGLVESGLLERIQCPDDGRVSFALLTDAGYQKLRDAAFSQVAGIRRLFVEHYSAEEIELLASLLSRLPDNGRDTPRVVGC